MAHGLPNQSPEQSGTAPLWKITQHGRDVKKETLIPGHAFGNSRESDGSSISGKIDIRVEGHGNTSSKYVECRRFHPVKCFNVLPCTPISEIVASSVLSPTQRIVC